MSLYALGDLHLSFGTDKPMDVFRGWEDYIPKLRENWNSTVNEDDTVIVPGDVSWSISLDGAESDFRWINDELNGNKILLKGNHDYWWTTAAKMNAFISEKGFNRIKVLHNNAYLVEGIAVAGSRGWVNDTGEAADKKVLLREAARLEMSIQAALKLGQKPVVFLHYPPIFGSEKNYYILDVLDKYEIDKCYYGHVHGSAVKNAVRGYSGGREYVLVSADIAGFTPIPVTVEKIDEPS